MSLWSIALSLFLIANPIGNIPAFVTIVKDFPFDRQKIILFRESIFSFLIAVAFLYLGDAFLKTIKIQQFAVGLSGGTLLFLVSLGMIFPPEPTASKAKSTIEPFIVPIATPLITGGGTLTTIMIYSAKEQNDLKITLACVIAWIAVTFVVVSSAYLNKLLGKRGLLALEQLMGMILSMISMDIIIKGASLFIDYIQK